MSKWKELHEAPPPEEPEEPATLSEVEEGFAQMFDTDEKEEYFKSLREARLKEKKKMQDIGATNYYFTVCFNNWEQLVEFCDRFGLDSGLIHMDGREVAKQFGKALQMPDRPRYGKNRIPKEYIDLAMDIPEQGSE